MKPPLAAKWESEGSGDTTPCRMTVISYRGRYCVKSLRSSYMGLYPQEGRQRNLPEAEEDDGLDNHELEEGIVRLELFRQGHVERHQAV